MFNVISTVEDYSMSKEFLWKNSSGTIWRIALGDNVGVHTFHKGISPKENVIGLLAFELAYFDFAVKHFNNYIMSIHSFKLGLVACLREEELWIQKNCTQLKRKKEKEAKRKKKRHCVYSSSESMTKSLFWTREFMPYSVNIIVILAMYETLSKSSKRNSDVRFVAHP